MRTACIPRDRTRPGGERASRAGLHDLAGPRGRARDPRRGRARRGACRQSRDVVDVKPMPGLEHLPFAEVWFHEIDDDRWREASVAARELGKTGLEVWTTDATPGVVAFLEERG